MLTQHRLQELFSYSPDTGLFTRLVARRGPRGHVGAIAGSAHHCGYQHITVDNKPYTASHLAWLYLYGYLPRTWIDHIDGDRANNRASNLREVDSTRNAWNRKMQRNNTTGVKGVTKVKSQQVWTASLRVGCGKRLFLGRFKTVDEAAAAVAGARRMYHGEFANHGG